MDEKHAAIYNEGWRDGFDSATRKPVQRAVSLHAAAALTLVVLAAIACIDRGTAERPGITLRPGRAAESLERAACLHYTPGPGWTPGHLHSGGTFSLVNTGPAASVLVRYSY